MAMNDLLGPMVLGLLAAPLAGAIVLALLGPGAARWLRSAIAIACVALLGAGLALAALAMAATGSPTAVGVPLGPLDPGGAAASALWTLAPAALALLFLVIALRSRSAVLVALAGAQALIVAVATFAELGVAPGTGDRALLLDPLALGLLLVSVLVGGAIVVYSLGYQPIHLRHAGDDPGRTTRFLAWLLVFLGAMHLLVLANDLRLLAVGWEVTTLCSYLLIGYDRTPEATVAARRALAYNLFGGVALALGLWLAGPHATLSELIARPEAVVLPAVLAAMAVAAATKSALAPFHPWLLGAMVAAAPVSALLHASTMVKAGSYLLLRISPVISGSALGVAVALLGAFSFALAALLALRERDLKRVLALSTVASLGLIAAAAGLGSPVALAAGLVFLVLHAFAKGLAFLVVGATEQVSGTRDLEALVGLARARPRFAAPLVLAAAAMTLPPFGIAATKWALLLAGSHDLPVVVLLAVGAAANVALWTAVVGRMLVRRPLHLARNGVLARTERLAIAGLALGSAAGLLVTGPLTAVIGDPAAEAGFGVAAPLADGWQLTALSGVFPILLLALTAAGILAISGALVWRRAVTPAPYLGGTNLAAGARPVFHGARGSGRLARSGGFYWGAAIGDPAGPSGLRRFVLAGGWLLVVVVVASAVLRATGVTP